MNKILGAILVLGALGAAIGCGNGGTSGAGGATSASSNASSSSGAGGAPVGSGTCDNTCAKSIALNCPAGEHDQSACVASCDMQQQGCSGQAATFQTYLDCIQSTQMVCGDVTSSPSSPDCLMQGLAILGCAGGSTGSTSSGGAGCFALPSFDSACVSQSKPPHAYACTGAAPAGCVVGTSDGTNNGTYCCP